MALGRRRREPKCTKHVHMCELRRLCYLIGYYAAYYALEVCWWVRAVDACAADAGGKDVGRRLIDKGRVGA